MNFDHFEDSATNEGVDNTRRNAALREEYQRIVKSPVIDKNECTLLWDSLQGFQGTPHGLNILLPDMGIYFGGFYISMPHKLLNDANVYTVFE